MLKRKNKQNNTDEAVKATLFEESESARASKNEKYEKIPVICYVTLAFALICAIIYLISCFNESFADFINSTLGLGTRFLLAQLSNAVRFSFAEFIILLSPVLFAVGVWYLLKYRCVSMRASLVSTVCVLSVLSIFLSTFVLCLGTGYRTTSLEEKLELAAVPIDKTELSASTEYLIDRINELSPNTEYNEEGFSKMPYSFEEMNRKLISAYDSASEEYDFITNFYSRLKPVMASEIMTYAHIAGVYSFFTGESNINVNLPDYTIPFTAAHELAHQRGIAREDEANMMAFLVCIRSDDPYIKYSAYLNMFEYVGSALKKADSKEFKRLSGELDQNVRIELVAYNNFFKKYEKSVSSQVSSTVNDVYLKAQGTEGKKSYGMVVDLTVAYFKSQKIIE